MQSKIEFVKGKVCYRLVLMTLLMWLNSTLMSAQFNFGNTGLMQMPTADMQKSGTFMGGFSWLDTSVLPQYRGYGWNQYSTMNYYVNVTVFPWIELNYACTLIRGAAVGSGKFFWNQDRHFDARFRIWKEGWVSTWTPQVVVGLNDVPGILTHAKVLKFDENSNEFWARIYVAATKHFGINGAGTIGAHLGYTFWGSRFLPFKGVSVGADFQLDKLHTGSSCADKWLAGLGVMAEYYDKNFNAGLRYGIPMAHRKDGSEIWSVNLITEMNQLKHFSGGVIFKVHLKE